MLTAFNDLAIQDATVGKAPRRSTALARDEGGGGIWSDKLWEWTQEALKDFWQLKLRVDDCLLALIGILLIM